MEKHRLIPRIIWYVILPIAIAFCYWFGLRALAFTDGTLPRIPALPKVFFDQTMYLEVMAKDIIHGFHILPVPIRPFVWLAAYAWPHVSLSEFYVIGIILSAIASLWLFAFCLQRIGTMSVSDARLRSVAAFLLVHAVLILRPGGPSWYVPFFLGALLLIWIWEKIWERHEPRAILFWILALILSSVYPWYFACIVAMGGLLFLRRFLQARLVLPVLGAGLLGAWAIILFREPIVQKVLSSYAVMLAYYGGVQFSHLFTLSNTILLMAAWIAFWFPQAIRSAREPGRTESSVFMLVAWVGVTILWFQSILTGLSIVPDHFIYAIWIFSALSWGLRQNEEHIPPREKRIRTIIGMVAVAYVLFVLVRMALGVFDWVNYPSLLIHIGSWTFLALAALPIPLRVRLSFTLLLGCLSVVMGMAAIFVAAQSRTDTDREVDGVRHWMMTDGINPDLRWCSDALTADYLFPSTGAAVYVTVSEKHDPVLIEQLQNRLVEIASFYNSRIGGDLYIWDDMILHDLEFPCRTFDPLVKVVNRFPISSEAKHFITGCDQSWADTERARVVARMDAQWEKPVPESSALCDRFVVRSRLKDAWRLPPDYRLLYQDSEAEVYGIR